MKMNGQRRGRRTPRTSLPRRRVAGCRRARAGTHAGALRSLSQTATAARRAGRAERVGDIGRTAGTPGDGTTTYIYFDCNEGGLRSERALGS